MLGKRIYIATPSYGVPCSDYYRSLYATVPMLEKAGYLIEWQVLEGCCYVHTARNKLTRDFLVSGADQLLFIDADIGWEAAEIVRLVGRDCDIVGAAAPFRVGEDNGFAVDWKRDKDGYPLGDIDSGLILANILPTAMMKIKRTVFFDLKTNKLAPLRIEYNRRTGDELERYLSFFDFEADEKNHVEYGEDVAFCRKWQKLGGQIYIEPDMTLRHHHNDTFREGNLHKFLTKPRITTSSAA